MIDCLFCITPYTDKTLPLLGPSVLSNVLKKNNFTSKVLDYNIELSKVYTDIFEGESWDDISIKFIKHEELYSNFEFIILMDKWVQEIIDYKPKYVAFTLFTTYMAYVVDYITKKIKEKTDIKIIVGGSSIKRFIEVLDIKLNSSVDLYDHIIIGYGEQTIINILNGNVIDKIINVETPDFTLTETPDFTDLNLNDYEHSFALPGYTTKGCTNNCPFCVIPLLYNYVELPMDRVIKDCSEYIDKYNIKFIEFQDSIINARFSRLDDLCTNLIPLNIQWSALWRIRKNIKEQTYKLLNQSGCNTLSIGVESGSEKVRNDMNKYYSNQDIFDNLDNFKKYNITAHLMLLVGFPSETEQDFQDTLNLLTEIKEKDYIINSIEFHHLVITTEEMKIYKDNENFLDGPRRYDVMKQHLIDIDFIVPDNQKIIELATERLFTSLRKEID
jgi:anaerobic magnesium-protoporphyrin IX monomethyl ester cyclase